MKTPGKRLVEELSKQLGPHMVWTETEQVLLANIERAEDRRAVFAARFEKAAADPQVGPSPLATLSGECRLLESSIAKWTALLDPSNERVKSQRHVMAANKRWHPAGG